LGFRGLDTLSADGVEAKRTVIGEKYSISVVAASRKGKISHSTAPRIHLPHDSPDQPAVFTVLNSYKFMATGLKAHVSDRLL
jgi:hypothetical protein